MTGLIDIAAEVRHAASRIDGQRLSWLSAIGVGRGFVLSGGIGVGRVRFLADGYYEPAEDGAEALILAAWSDLPNRSEIIDLVAVRIGGTERWATRRGLATVLGSWALPPIDQAAVHVFSSPWTWLRHDARGLLIVGPVGEARDLLFNIPKIVAETVDLGREVDAELRRALPVPKIMVPDLGRAA